MYSGLYTDLCTGVTRYVRECRSLEGGEAVTARIAKV